ncbi:MAG: hypothetical protein O7G85_00420 [Planctomycetota bacterium]|nr:hypothetical protein [Planctomycetota bacterium]
MHEDEVSRPVDFILIRGFDDPMHDEGPSLEDLNRFSGDTAYCSECGQEIWDMAEFCPDCKAHLGGHTLSNPPDADRINKKMIVIISIILLIAFALLYVL